MKRVAMSVVLLGATVVFCVALVVYRRARRFAVSRYDPPEPIAVLWQ